MTTALVLVSPQDLEPFHIEADSSDFASRAVLSQRLPREEKWHLVAFYSKFLSPVEQNYEIHDKEMLAIIRALEEWRHFLEGACKGTPLFPPLNTMTTLWSYLSLFTSDT